jgi:hypothetical protein
MISLNASFGVSSDTAVVTVMQFRCYPFQPGVAKWQAAFSNRQSREIATAEPTHSVVSVNCDLSLRQPAYLVKRLPILAY